MIPAQVEKLVRAIRWRWLRNFNWCVSSDKLFPVACVDDGWQATVERLVHEADLIVVDLSGVTQSILWELGLLHASGAMRRTLFVAQAFSVEQARAALKQFAQGAEPPPQLHVYATEGRGNAQGALTAAARALMLQGSTVQR